MKKVVNVGVLSVVAFFAIMLCGYLTSCSKGDDGDEGDGSISSKLVGTWVHSNVRLVFKADRTGSDILDLSFINEGLEVSNFKWNVGERMLHLTFDGSGNHYAGTYSYYYTLEDDILSIWYDDGEFRGAFIKQ